MHQSRIVDKLRRIGFKRNEYQQDHWQRSRWYWPFSYELVILGDCGVWMFDNGHGTRFWSACYDDLFDCIKKGWV